MRYEETRDMIFNTKKWFITTIFRSIVRIIGRLFKLCLSVSKSVFIFIYAKILR